MSKLGAQLALYSTLLLLPAGALAQQPPSPILSLGNAVVTAFSGTVAPDPRRIPRNKSAIDLTFINPDAASARVFDVRAPGFVWDGRAWPAPKTFDVFARDVGQVFGIALDDDTNPNIYLTATSAYGLQIVVPGSDNAPERVTSGHARAQWMRGQFGPAPQGGPGSIWKVDGRTGQLTLFANVVLDGAANAGPGLGNIAYDRTHRQLFVSDLATGTIHRFDLAGRELQTYDHGVTARPARNLPPVPFDPSRRTEITDSRFDAENPDTWGLAVPERRVFALAAHRDGRLYYSVWDGPQIWSVGIQRDGRIGNDPRWELDVPATPRSFPVTDMVFSDAGAMILAQRGGIVSSYDYSVFARPAEARVLRFTLEQPDDPNTPSRWIMQPDEYAVGFRGDFRNTDGGVDLGYGWRDGRIDTGSCAATLWTTGQSLRDNPSYAARLRPGGPFLVSGLQASPADQVRDRNTPPWTAYFVDYDARGDDARASGHIGSVRILRADCGPGGPGLVAQPGPPVLPPPVFPPPLCPQGFNPDGTCGVVPIDLAIDKKVSAGRYDPATGTWTFTFTLSVTNVGNPFIAQNHIAINDPVPNGLVFTAASGTNWTCPAGQFPISNPNTLNCTYNFGPGVIATGAALPPLVITVTVRNAGKYENCATVGIRGAPWLQETTLANNRDCATIEVPVDLAIAKRAGERRFDERTGTWSFQYTLTVTNVGAAHNGPIQVNDPVPAGLTFTAAAGAGWTCNPTPLSSGALACTHPGPIAHNQTFTITITVTARNAGTYDNCAQVGVAASSGLQETTLENNRSCIPIELPVDLMIAKTVGQARFDQGSGTWRFQYTLTVTNLGAAHNGPIQVSDPVPAGLTFTGVTAAGWNCVPSTPLSTGALSCTRPGPFAHNQSYTITINATAANPGTYNNCAQVGLAAASGLQETSLANNNACIPIEITDKCELEVVKSNPIDPTLDLDLNWWKDNKGIYPGFCTPGSSCIFTITIRNKSSAACIGTVTIGEKTTTPDGLTNMPMNIVAISPTLCTTLPPTTPFTCDASINLAGGASATYMVYAQIPMGTPGLPTGNPVVATGRNCFGIGQPPAGGQPWPTFFTDVTTQACSEFRSCAHTCHMQDTSRLSIAKTAMQCAGGKCTFTVTVTNNSSTPFVDPISIIETGPPNSTYDPNGTAPPWGCGPYVYGGAPGSSTPVITTAPPNVVDCKYPPSSPTAPFATPIPAGGSSTFNVTFILAPGTTGTVENCVDFNLSSKKTPQPDDHACATATVTPVPPLPTADLAIAKTGGTSSHPQVNAYAFHLTVTNVGAAFNGNNVITVTDVVPAGMTFNTATGPNWICATLPVAAGGTLTCTYSGTGPTTPNQSLGTIDITATAAGSAPFPPFENCAVVALLPASGRQDSNTPNNRACVTVTKPHLLASPVCDERTMVRRGGDCVCRFPNMAKTPDGACACAREMDFVPGRGCVPRVVCTPPKILNAAGRECVCPEGTMPRGQGCTTRPECRAPMVPGPTAIPGVMACICPAPLVQRGRECVRPPECRPPMIQGPRGRGCICPPGTVQRGRECARPPECRPPMVQGPGGRGCICPPGTQQRGRECVRPPQCRPPMIQGPAGRCMCPPGTLQRGPECVRLGPTRPQGEPGGPRPREPGRGPIR